MKGPIAAATFTRTEIPSIDRFRMENEDNITDPFPVIKNYFCFDYFRIFSTC